MVYKPHNKLNHNRHNILFMGYRHKQNKGHWPYPWCGYCSLNLTDWVDSCGKNCQSNHTWASLWGLSCQLHYYQTTWAWCEREAGWSGGAAWYTILASPSNTKLLVINKLYIF